jgi:phosphotransferase family enzyme
MPNCQDLHMVTAAGVRIGWSDLPARVRRAVEEILGSPVATARKQPGGFSPGTADRVVTEAGGRAFVKAVGTHLNPRSVVMARDEGRVTAWLPEAAPTPRLLGSYDDGDWVALVLEDIDGRHPRTPWVENEIDATVTALTELARAVTPAPVPGAPRASEQLGGDFEGWTRLAGDVPEDLDPWVVAHLDELRAASARGLVALAAGDTLTHCDIRADNLLVRPDGRVVIVDWPWACVGPDWLDTVCLALNIIVHGGDADRVLSGVDARLAADVITGLTGFFTYVGRQPDPPGIPTVRAFQRAQADALLPWVRAHHPR